MRFWCPEVDAELLSQALNERTGVLCSLLCCRVGSLSELECQGLSAVGLPLLRPRGAGLQEEKCLAVSCSTTVLPRKKARQDFHHIFQQRGFHLLSRPHAGSDTHTCGSYQREHARADSHEFAVKQAHPRQHRCKQTHAAAGLLAVIEADVFIFAWFVLAQALAYMLLCSQTLATELSHGTGLFLGALLRIVSMFQMLES